MKTVIITGASRGIGAQTAREFANAGYYVFINYNNSRDEAQLLQQQINQQAGRHCCEAVRADITDERQVADMIDLAVKRTGRLDVLINNAGVALSGLITDTSLAEWQTLMDVNVTGVFLCCKYALRHMTSKKRGNIINISSIWGLTGASCEVCYSASKGAVIGLTKALAKEAGPSNIRVNCVAPGVIATDMMAEFSKCDIDRLKDASCLGSIGSARDIAKACLFLASEDAGFITGQVLSPNGGIVI